MLKPPFTIIILKNTKHPVTVRVTTGMIMLFTGFFTLSGLILGLISGYFVFAAHSEAQLASTAAPVADFVQSDMASYNADENKTNEIRGISVKRRGKGEFEFDLDLISPLSESQLYMWMILNPESGIEGEMLVYPRNPLFRGLPVDYRNGIVMTPSESSSLTLSLENDIDKIKINGFRVLVYSTDGEILADRYFNEN